MNMYFRNERSRPGFHVVKGSTIPVKRSYGYYGYCKCMVTMVTTFPVQAKLAFIVLVQPKLAFIVLVQFYVLTF